ncbi:hypothetical protein NU08_3334 [Flavobacterium anhuiense]|uniref:Uncharacterized protein n=1 Tax=Flavobacterium anhuiense TaxID=459526 RepID=A0A444VVN6_9FLAO|nr:hypothetical protein NU08_3334 [Flavobacterium anhuiense]
MLQLCLLVPKISYQLMFHCNSSKNNKAKLINVKITITKILFKN